MKSYGLIGKSLDHSFSPAYFSKKFSESALSNCSYSAFELNHPSEVLDLLHNNPTILGLNVTVPFKEDIIQYLDQLDAVSSKIGAVNTIKIERNGSSIQTTGYNTDVIGFKKLIAPYLKNHKHKKALVLGSGGASKAVLYCLENSDMLYDVVSRKPNDHQLSYANLNKRGFKDFEIIINTTPLGTFPNVQEKPDIPYNLLTANNVLIDLVYNPEQTAFLKEGITKGCQVKNGLEMLLKQAEASWEIWVDN